MTNSVKTLSVLTFSAVCSILAITVPARSVLAQVTLSSTVNQNGSFTSQSGGAYSFAASPYDFTGQQQSLASINTIGVTLTIFDGDTAPQPQPDNYDYNDLFLGLDGINTGIALNGFRSGTTDTLTITGTPTNSGAILTALQQDGQLQGSIIDTDSDGGDPIFFPGSPTTTTLTLSGNASTPVPFEFSPGLGILALGALGGMAQLKSKLQKQKSSVSAFSQH